ncbi:CobW domain-containing protein [Boletus reticuloceps]|uniref:CobW domain-containing protein n=1 Tax=Boletus reticuloceps TaxID=495285 RepID=A0A8I2YLZ4_9AGAM|nr:CobW domain-containing protein [Boletus reticuloceps]
MLDQTQIPHIPITVFTGFLGAGKTSIILSLLPKLPKDYKVVLLKNEFGDIEAVDSQLAKQSSLAAVSEILNGCLCCVLVGQMKNALLEIRGRGPCHDEKECWITLVSILDNFRPDRIIIECSGSAFPATLAFQIRELERETNDDFKLDAIVTVVDAENFSGYEDTSPTAKMQASYSDIILINKWEHVDDRALDLVLDHLHTLNDLTPKIRCNGRDGVDPNLLFGVDTKLFRDSDRETSVLGGEIHHDEVQTITISKGSGTSEHLCHNEACNDDAVVHGDGEGVSAIEERVLRDALEGVSKETVWRIKGFVRLESGVCILNWAFGRYELTPCGKDEGYAVRLTVMGERGEVKRSINRFSQLLGVCL